MGVLVISLVVVTECLDKITEGKEGWLGLLAASAMYFHHGGESPVQGLKQVLTGPSVGQWRERNPVLSSFSPFHSDRSHSAGGLMSLHELSLAPATETRPQLGPVGESCSGQADNQYELSRWVNDMMIFLSFLVFILWFFFFKWQINSL